MNRSKAQELTGIKVQELWDEAYSLVKKGDYSAARLVIEQSIPSETVALEKFIQRHMDANPHAKEASVKPCPPTP